MGSFVAFEIGNAITKVISGNKNKSNITIKKYSVIENNEIALMSDGTLNIHEILPLLKKELKELKIRSRKLYITLSGKSEIVRLREFPMVSLKQMREMLIFDAQQFLPYDVEAFAMDFRINQIISEMVHRDNEDDEQDSEKISEDVEEKKVEVMVAVHPKNMVEDQINLANSLKVDVERVTSYTDAVFTYFMKYILDDDRNILVVDVGSKHTRITMFHGKKYFANTSSDTGIEAIVRDYSMLVGKDIDETVNILFGDGVSDDGVEENNQNDEVEFEQMFGVDTTSEKLSKLANLLKKRTDDIVDVSNVLLDSDLEGVYESVAKDIRRMIEFFKTRKFGYSVDEIYLIGGGANLTNLDRFLYDYHGIPVNYITDPNISSNRAKTIPAKDYNLLIPVIGSVIHQEVSL